MLPLKCLDDESRLAIVIRGHLKDMVSNGKATCVLLARDMAGRRYGQCMLEGQDIAAKMIEAGWGIVIPRSADTAAFHQLLEAYDTLERHARAAGYGIWARSGQ
ncbi:thermonuclease family protein [Ferruginivarius sediminum]|uniref:TNase-like domain-containing protein n=1 Tax=Ferruginivarius sediminum TaxID=2661937 RepID=A0A369T874_9PROT|nr:thermonuclease family protein [Ferruginivarius sediminum]RDD60377.1 hypothetical protein DRB17_18245 [Ferruginivarius sediminum]